MPTDFGAWLAKDVPPRPYADSKKVRVSKTNPNASLDWPYVALAPDEWFDAWDGEEDRKVLVKEITALQREDLGEVVTEYRGYGHAYLKNGRTLATRGEAQYVLLTDIPHHLKERLESQPWPAQK